MQTEIATATAATFNPANRPGYSTKSNCKRAALKAGIPEHLIVIAPLGANWQYFRMDESEHQRRNSTAERAGEEADAAAGIAAEPVAEEPASHADAVEQAAEQEAGEEIEATKKKGGKGKKAPKAKAAPKAAKPAKAKAEKGAKEPKGDSLKAKVLAMLRRASGASTGEIETETGWQSHTIRAFISTVPRKAGLLVKTEKHPTRGRVYRTEAGE